MQLTAKEIYEKSFKRAFKGYDDTEVDEFLDKIIKTFVQMEEETVKLNEAKAVLVAENEQLKKDYEVNKSEYIDKAQKAKNEARTMEERVTQTLLTAQRTAEILLAEAKSQAESMVAEALEKSARIDSIYNIQMSKQKKNIEMLRGLIEQCKTEYEYLMDNHKTSFMAKSLEVLSTIDDFNTELMDLETIHNQAENEEAKEKERNDFQPTFNPPKVFSRNGGEKPIPKPINKQIEKLIDEYEEKQQTSDLLSEVALPNDRASEQEKPKSSDYSWIYNEESEIKTIEINLPRKTPEEEQRLAQLISELE